MTGLKRKVFLLTNIPLYITIIAMAISPAFALGAGNRNLLLIGIMSLSPLVLLRYPQLYSKDIALICFMLGIVLFPLISYPETMRWSTVMYSIMFCLAFMGYNRLIHNAEFTITDYIGILKILIYAYAITLIIQQFCVLTGLPIFNLGNYNPNEPWKLNSLSAEPSHTARIVALLMYCYITMKEIIEQRRYSFSEDFKGDRWIWIGFLWTMITMGSSTAFIFIFIVLLKFLRFKTLLPLLGIVVGIFIAVELMGITAMDRTYKTAMATLTLNEKAIMKADGSAAARIVPTIILIKKVSITDMNGWFGHGIDQLSNMKVIDFSSIGYGNKGVSGSMFTVWFDYGFIVFTLFVLFSLTTCLRKGDFLSFCFWFMLVFLYGVNNQMVWLCITLLYTNKVVLYHHQRQSKLF